MAKELILMAGTGAPALDQQPLTGADEDGVAPLLIATEERRDGDAEGRGQCLQGIERR
jgi:hypothetical protein